MAIVPLWGGGRPVANFRRSHSRAISRIATKIANGDADFADYAAKFAIMPSNR